MDLKDPKTQKILLASLGALLLIYFWHSKVYQPNDQNLQMKLASYERLAADLKTIELKAKSLEGLRKEYDKLLTRYQSIEELLPENDQVPDFLMQMHMASLTSQSQITEISPQVASGEAFYNSSQYAIHFYGTYHELGRFLAAVANFPFITNVSELRLTGLPAAEILGEGGRNLAGEFDRQTLEANFYLSTYYVKPEEKLQGVQL
ncbi:MAG: type 4a pilus biogenesis protein PilO [candidate division Zixibacteria bacterium]|nr:type 4a pilus biogenesis protein PilO [candidate division Zixibacteria bacterium]